jgi:HlyD family secretion protein
MPPDASSQDMIQARRGDATGGGEAVAVQHSSVPIGFVEQKPSRLGAALRGAWALRWRVVAVLALLGLVTYFAAPRVLGPVVAAQPVLRGDLVQSVVATGRVETPHRVNIASQVTGMVAEIPVAEGQAVQAGQVLVVLEDSELRATVAQAESAVALAETRLRQMVEVTLPVLQENLAQAQSNLLNAEQQFSRSQTLSNSGYGTLVQRDADRKTLDVARALVRAAQFQVTSSSPGGTDYVIAENNLRQAQAALKIATSRFGYARIQAPVAGTLIARTVEPGWVVTPNQTLMVLSPDGETQVVVQIDEKNLGLVALGQQAIASADAYPDQKFAAELVYINPAVDPDRASVEAKLRVAAPPAFLRQDMTISVDIAGAERKATLILPVSAVHDAAGPSPWVLRIVDGRARRQAVGIGLRGVRQVEILSGLSEGDVVVPVSAPVADGGRVRVTQTPTQ